VQQDKEGLLAVLDEQVTFTADGGGKVSAVRNVVLGAARTARLLLGVQAKWGHLVEYVLSDVNGEPGMRSFMHSPTRAAVTPRPSVPSCSIRSASAPLLQQCEGLPDMSLDEWKV
jgi:RNA polymerase sigma-70 factor (ECF subfamily)